ncbi:MAG: aminomethyl-transferring glycine dehydrogenase [Flavobacteriaceae bacterium]
MNTNTFSNRHIGPRGTNLEQMLEDIQAENLDQLIDQTIPTDIRLNSPLDLEPAISEAQFAKHIAELAEKNKVYSTYIGLGYHPTRVPAVIQRNIFENPGWYTAYTPYQAEIAQGRLEALLNFQTMVCDLTGMELANSSLLDEGTAAAEAMSMLFASRSRGQKKANANKFFISDEVLPQTISILQTRAIPIGIELVIGNVLETEFNQDYFGVLVQYPGKHGAVVSFNELSAQLKQLDIKLAVAADLMSLALLTPPGEWGADVVVGTTQRFGIPLGYGGPHAAFFATKESYKRNIPGRIIGVTEDVDGNRALRMALQTREQHIKREKATSNICTAQVLLAVMAGMYGVYHGPKGIQFIASKINLLANSLAEGLSDLGFKQENKAFFDTIVVELNEYSASQLQALALAHEMNFNYISEKAISISINEETELKDIQNILDVFAQMSGQEKLEANFDLNKEIDLKEFQRTSPYLTHEVFNTFHSETEMMRYIKRLERKDLSLNHSMISLGSCTMKLNAASEMLPLSSGLWGNIHPFAPVDQAAGYHEVFKNLEHQLNIITGFAGTSLQPNSGAQGEFAGLMVIRAFHENNGDQHRNICLIPASAHGTNPASAVMAGMKVVVTKTSEDGNIDLEDLKEKAELHKDNLAALMVTYPSTHGVFESAIKQITKIIHDNGGQVYMDGANMNAQVGLTNPAIIGADVCHLNLHKTFAIPHGGGGPGMGPICVAEHLVPFLPSNPVISTGGAKGISGISAAPWGSSLVLLISYSYIKMLGTKGLTESTKYAILNANYLKAKLEPHFPILYTGEQGRAAHEMIVDCRAFKAQGIEVTDIAKRLMDYGFHAPTVSFPVAGTLMIEPTESENKDELDRFINAMVSIREEIKNADVAQENNPLKNAPHTLEMITSDHYDLPYSRQVAAFPLAGIKSNKFWPSVRRVKEAFGDRNLICSCNPISDYID